MWAGTLLCVRAMSGTNKNKCLCLAQAAAICAGLTKVVPLNLLQFFTWRQLEMMICGSIKVCLTPATRPPAPALSQSIGPRLTPTHTLLLRLT